MVKKRIAISGKITAGKTTASDHLIQQYGYQRVSFATPIKQITNWFKDYSTIMNKQHSEEHMKAQNSLFKYLVNLNRENYVNASRCFDVLMDDIFPHFDNINWSIEKSDRWRQLLQEIGDGLRMKVDSDIWMNYLVYSLEENGLYICDDLRYKNELKVMQEAGFTVIRLAISPDVQQQRIESIYGKIDPNRLLHPSETDLDNEVFPYSVDADKELTYVLHDIRQIAEAEGVQV